MPEGYEHLRDKLMDQGKDIEEATRLAAAIWNKNHPEEPVGRGYDESSGYKKPESFHDQVKRYGQKRNRKH